MRNRFSLVVITLCSLGLNGCTVLGLVADNQMGGDKYYKKVDQQTGQVTSTELATPFTDLGMALDGAVIDTVKKLTTQENTKPKEVCKHNGYFMECRPAGKQREDLID